MQSHPMTGVECFPGKDTLEESTFGGVERRKWEGPAEIAGPSQSAGKFGVAFRSFGT
jgi:hypothetical protein